ncbi:pyrroline-5-carboxylate reductase [Marinobacterium nitratireducens]|uniref:Pyrroline-5-carboxylate reductase n=1 Tax=Marinobacterium nitratireducens TaxID=518897 RepID=A0A917ZPM9_9GAMM|nr:NAD(P)-binding domain-containing protein [Marinobacterium nitratireducens]GGO87046.1 pyrroline-5-carboxylate reductase [Marinobacterium nitratireducens]
MTPILGIIGAGHLARYTVAGLRSGGDRRRILISPRNRGMAAAMAADLQCEVMDSNQAVIDAADLVMLAVRPEALEAVLDECRFPDGKAVISCIAGVPAARFPANIALVRAMPLSCAEFGAGAVPIFPDDSGIRDLLAPLGSIIGMADEQQFELATIAACYNGWLLDLFATVSDWLAQQGLTEEQARELTLAATQGAAALGAGRSHLGLRELSDGIATPNTLTRLGLDHLKDAGAFEPWAQACELLQRKLTPDG